MVDEFGYGVPEGAANWHPSIGLEPDFDMTDEELEAAIHILEVIHTQVPTKRHFTNTFF